MTISRIKQVTLESGNYGDFDYYAGGTAITSGGYTGDYKASQTGYGHNTDYRIAADGTYQLRGGMWVYHGNAGVSTRPFRWTGDGVSTQMVYIQFTNSTTIMNLYCNGTLRDTSLTMPYQSWYHLAWDIKINGTNGWAYIYQGGEEIMSYDGNTGTADIDYLTVGPRSGAINAAFSPYSSLHFDDLYLDDTTGETSPTSPPILRFWSIRPNGNGNYAQWTGSDGNSTDNYLLVDEQAANGGDYVGVQSADQYDSYALEACPSIGTGATIQALIPYTVSIRSGSTEQLAVGTRLSSTDLIGSDQIPTNGSWGYKIWERQTTKPGGGSWSTTDVDSTELVLKSRGSY